MKLLFIHSHPRLDWWLDGLHMALDELAKEWEITYFNPTVEDLPKGKFDFMLGWGFFNAPAAYFLQSDESHTPKGLCLAGNGIDLPQTNPYSIIFHETDWVKDNYLDGYKGCKFKKAFGVNTALFSQVPVATPIVFDYLGVGSLSTWKRWDKMKAKKGIRLVVGEFQKDNELESTAIIHDLVTHNVMVSNQVHPYDLANLYSWARTVYIPAGIHGGGERAVLEARSCGCNVEIEPDNPKLQELLDLKDIPTHLDYAKALKEGIESCA